MSSILEEVTALFQQQLRSSRSEWVIGRNRFGAVMGCMDYTGRYLYETLRAPAATLQILGLPFVVSDEEPDALYLREREH